MTKTPSPRRQANEISMMLNAVFGQDRFPVRIRELAIEYSRKRFPDDPLTDVLGDKLPGFEGALAPARDGKRGWGILYNSAITSPGRINFTLAHEFGHYLLHRLAHPEGIYCTEEDMRSWDSKNRKVESEANEFAANLLMPFDDFRRQIAARDKPDLEMLSDSAARYEVSMQAAVLRWLQFTTRRSVLVVAREGFILWARSSEPALKSGAFFRTANVPPVEIPEQSLAARRASVDGSKGSAEFDAGVWFREPCEEMVLFSDRYDFSMSLLHLGPASSRFEALEEEEQEETFDRMMNRTPGSSWLG
ncbi:ImmA/IrrE family metallo-endopeptidase [Thalassobaculum sp. OXR-137]|uniref:ImmA/IrrE family metallo-endopeptidase n=1 Tax=Thalassobaculum sp. OXR-137 TaxID=3100173 RepID=UPI002AC91336|nr:ImmA/IrrE family metallo-endopeptidase [Thalassobaculum sp. OXR-137]WPZ35825.1 ImmA/IrrE family metallo-endopeptidase [Thalassobaculum sp. OXR-137]